MSHQVKALVSAARKTGLRRPRRSNRILVVCQECGKHFLTASLLPVCSRCNSSDIEPEEV